jgi:hypothetical protein
MSSGDFLEFDAVKGEDGGHTVLRNFVVLP